MVLKKTLSIPKNFLITKLVISNIIELTKYVTKLFISMKALTTITTMLLFACVMATSVAAQQLQEHRIGVLDAEIYSVDQSHSTLKFIVGFMGLTDVEGTFDRYSMTIFYNEGDMSKTEVVLRIYANSIDTGNDFRDRDLKSARFFDTENHPELTFRSTSVEPAEEAYTLKGDLTIKGITRKISMPLRHVLKRTADRGWGNIRIGFSGNTVLKRNDYNIHGGDFWGLKALSEEVKVEFTILGTISNLDRHGYDSREKPSIAELLEEELADNEVSEIVELYHTKKEEQADEYNFAERELNLLVNRLYQRNELDEALVLGKLYVGEFPESHIAWTTLGEIYSKRGEVKDALDNFRKAYELDAKDDLAAIAIKRLEKKI